ncbi:thiol reductant ABC exporter subunit CydC [Streptomyces sp. 6N223]|uniref:thiol reductant ABC exporter subunit CydC n=1 Tax=Streptomyces sp. 6N223 TaxID=3457412 RepID=UPI003FD657E8
MSHAHADADAHDDDRAAPAPAPVHPRPLRGLLPYLLSRRRAFARVVASGIVLSASTIAAAGTGAWLIGGAVTGEPLATLAPRIAWLVALTATALVSVWWQSETGHDWAFRLLRELRIRIFDGLERATPGRILGKRTGDLASTAVNDVNTTELFFAHVAGDYVGAVVVSLATLGVIAALAPPAALVAAVLMALVAVVPFALARRAAEEGRAMRAELGNLNAEALDGVQGLRELTVFGQGRAYRERILRRTDELNEHQRRYARRSGAERAATELLLAAGMLLTLVATVREVDAGALEPALAPVVMVLTVASLGPIAAVSASARTIGEVRAAAARVLAITEYPAQVPEAPGHGDGGGAAPPPPADATVRFEDVRFGYAPDRPPVLDGVSFTIAPGQSLALVGASGAGKSTCAHLLLRFWDPGSGRITLGGRELRTLPTAELRRLVSLVPQDVYLFNASIRDNIRLGRPEASEEEVRAAACQAHAGAFIEELPEGYDTRCGERGAALSGGQRQRIALARALLTRSPVLVLDEAVSQLDTASEAAINSALAEARASRALLVIAHRLSTIRTADRVALLREGRVVAAGTHEELLGSSPAYRELLATQQVHAQA